MLTEKNIRNIFIYAVPKFVGYGLNLIILPILTRLLTPDDFGIIILAGVFPNIATNIFTLGVAFGVERYYFEYRKEPEKLNALISSSQVFLYVSLVLSSCIVFILKGHISKLIIGDTKYGFAIFIAFIAAYFGQIITFYLRLYQNMEKAAIHSIFTVVQTVTSVVISLLFVLYFKMSYMGMLYGSLTGALVVCLAMLFHFNRDSKYLFSRKILMENIKYGLQVVPKSFSGFVNKFFDKYMLNTMLSLSAAGIFNIGQTIGNTMFFFMGTIWSSFQPVCYREVFDKGKDGSVSAGRIFTIFSYITLMPVLLLILFAQEIVYAIAPAPYYEAIDIIIIISGGVATQTFGMFVGVQYAYSKKAYWIFPITVIGTIANVVANIILIPKYGLIGAGVSVNIGYIAMYGILTFAGQKLYRVQYEWKTIVQLYAIIGGAIISVLYLRAIEFHNLFLYLIKVVFIAFFILEGIWAKVITRRSIEKVFGTFFNCYGRKEVQT
ncbi:MAG: polysaccharide biosynthesis protein [Candidatus Brocadia sp.]|jgi:O-antigen/teichoic acid export membrane protein